MSVELLERGVRGAFYTLEEAAHAVDVLEENGFAQRDVTLFSPIPTAEVEEHFVRPRSPVRYMTLAGGILGCITGFALTYWTFFAWPLHVGGKPISSFPVTVVIMFADLEARIPPSLLGGPVRGVRPHLGGRRQAEREPGAGRPRRAGGAGCAGVEAS